MDSPKGTEAGAALTETEIAALRKLDRAPDGSCWYCKTVMRGHFEGCPVASIPRLLDEVTRLRAENAKQREMLRNRLGG